MSFPTDIWKLLAGLAIFLLGMKFLEESLQQLAGRPFKLFLKKQTASKPKAILGGALVAGVLQSSSVVNLMILAFVGAGVIQMKNALAVLLGTNLGSTFTNWIIATVGFRVNIENFAFPLAGIFGLALSVSNKGSRLYQWSKFVFGFGFMLIGLGYIKTGMEVSLKQADLAVLNQYPAFVFLLAGFLITSLIQSSSATVAIVLSALHIHAVSLYAATALVLGSEVGTTLKLVLASFKGAPAEKRLALGNLLFNIITAFLVFIFLWPINRFISTFLGIKNNLLALVVFQSLVNIAGILLFYPFLNRFGRFLENRFKAGAEVALFIHKVSVNDTGPALEAFSKEVKHFLLSTIHFTRNVFNIPDEESLTAQLGRSFQPGKLTEQYEFLKNLHGESLRYAVQLQAAIPDGEEIRLRLQQLIAANRNTMYAAKNIKDAIPDITLLRNSSNDVKFGFYRQAAGQADQFCKKLTVLLLPPDAGSSFEELSALYNSVSESYAVILQQLYSKNPDSRLNESEISTLINFNREMFSAYKSYVFAIKGYLLNTTEASWFDKLPGFIR